MGSKVVIAIIIAFIIGLGVGVAAAPALWPKQAPKKKMHLLFSLDWAIYGRHAPYFVALEKGFFEEEGLSVEIVRGYGSADTIQKVATGVVDVGFGDISALIIAKAKDPKFNAKMVAMIYARAPFAVFALKSSGIDEPKDLEGKVLTASGPGDVNYVLFPYFAKVTGIDPDSIEWKFVKPEVKVQLLVNGEVDAITEFAMQKPVVDKATAEIGGANMILWADYGVNIYSNGIVFREDFIKEHPEVVRGFVRAIVKGFLYTFEHPDEAVDILLKRFPTLDREVARAEIDILKKLVLVPEAEEHGIGYFDPERVQATIDAITEVFNLPRKVSPGEIYTDEFLPGKISLELVVPLKADNIAVHLTNYEEY